MKKYELSLNESNIATTISEDWLGRNRKLINLMKLLSNVKENFVISIDGNWGSGKTFFVKQLKYICDNLDEIDYFKSIKDFDKIEKFSKENLVVYYNAWENDNHEIPLESLIYCVLNEYPKHKNVISNPEEVFDSLKPILKNLMEKLSFGLIPKESFDTLKSFSDLSESIITIEEKKEALNKLFDNILGNNKRILLIVDELDRCKPDYAVKMLETLKHFYDNEKLTIMVVTNNRQLSHTIKKFYGNSFDGYGYLNKMYDTVISLEIENLENYVKKHFEIIKSTHLPENVSYLLFQYLGFSYRECNKYMSIYKIVEPYINYQDSFNKNAYLFEANIILPITLALKIKSIDEYNKFINTDGDKFIEGFINFLNNIEKSEEYKSWFGDILGLKDEETLEMAFKSRYKKMFTNIKYDSFPYLEAISLLGNNISFFDK